MADNFNPYYYFNSPTVMAELRKLLCDYKKGNLLIQELIEKTENLDKHISGIIQKMYDDGDFDKILEEIITPLLDSIEKSLTDDFNTLSEKLNTMFSNRFSISTEGTLEFERYFRDIDIIKNYKLLNDVAFHACFNQGGVVYELNGQEKFCGAFTDGRLEDTDGCDFKISSDWTHTNYIQSDKKYLGHCNGMTYNYNDNYFYMAPSTEYDNGNKILGTHIYKIDPETFDVETSTIDPYTPDIAYYKGKLYICDTLDEFKVYTYDFASGATTYVSSLKVNNQGDNLFYNFDVADNKIFMVDTIGKRIQVFDLATGDFIINFSVPQYDKQHRFLIKEIESITCFDDGRMYISTIENLGLSSQTQEQMISIFCGDFKTNNPTPIQKYTDSVTGGNIVCVKPISIASSSLRLTDGARPDGTADNPFATINEAVAYINANNKWEHCRIRLGGNLVTSAAISSTKSIDIISWDFEKNTRPDTNYWFGGLFAESFSNLFLFFVDLYCSNTQSEYDGVINGYNSTIHSYAINTNRNETSVMVEKDYDVALQGCYYRYSESADKFTGTSYDEAKHTARYNSYVVGNN